MTAFGKLIRTTAFRLTLVYLLLFALFAASLLGYFAWNTRRLINEQITTTVNAEIGELSDIYARARLRGLVVHDREPGAAARRQSLSRHHAGGAGGRRQCRLAVAGRDGQPRAGRRPRYRRLDEQDNRRPPRAGARHRTRPAVSGCWSAAISRNGGGCSASSRRPRNWSLLVVIVLGLGGGIFVARRVLRRIDAMTGTTQRIMAGDLTGRLPVGRSGDELDRLAENLNAMLERIEALMMGLKEVSDNIAHDLKTPLTRLRNRAEEALARSGSEAEYRARAGTDHRGIRRPDPHLQRAVDDRARRVRAGARQHGRFRRRRRRQGHPRTLRAAGRRRRHDLARQDRAGAGCTATAN